MKNQEEPPLLSVVTTMYNSAPYLREFHERIVETARRITSRYEIIFVNDGSPDDSLEVALSLFESNNRVRVLDLSRNFGQHKAIMTGLSHARGDLVFLLDCDLEEEPETLLAFKEKMEEEEVDVVYGVQESRKGGLIEKITGRMFYSVFNWLSGTKLTPNLITMRLMSRRYVESLTAHRDQAIFLAGLWEITGYRQLSVTVQKHATSATTYSMWQKLGLFGNAITSFSIKPLLLLFALGTVLSVCSGVYIVHLLLRKIVYGITVSGWTSLIVSIWFFGGLTILSIGIVGIYVSRLFIETKQRPYTIVRSSYEHEDVADSSEAAGKPPETGC